MQLDEPFAGKLAQIALAGIHRAYPNKIGHLLRADQDAAPPRALTPMFFGCFDWHSAVHSHWTLVRLSTAHPDAAWAQPVRQALATSFTANNLAAELDYSRTRPSFEMPYGVAWLLLLGSVMTSELLQPLVDLRREHFLHWLSRLPAPIRTGEHNQTAFAMGMIIDAAISTGDDELVARVAERAREFYAGDTDAPLAYEPSAFDFLSPALAEANLMRRVLGADEFAAWLDGFLPNGYHHAPVQVVDRSDGKLAHYDGLNFSRSWALHHIAATLPDGHARKADLAASADNHRRAGLDGIESPHYAGQHWLPSFALLSYPDA